jgi:hypothetical protein
MKRDVLQAQADVETSELFGEFCSKFDERALE